MSAARAVDLSVQIGALRLRNPILAASGTFGYGLEFAHLVKLEALGGFVTANLFNDHCNLATRRAFLGPGFDWPKSTKKDRQSIGAPPPSDPSAV